MFGVSTHLASSQSKVPSNFHKRKLSPEIIRNMMIKNINSKVIPVVVYKDKMPGKHSANALGLKLNQKSGGTSGMQIGVSSKETFDNNAHVDSKGVLKAVLMGPGSKVQLLGS
jgi:hypothetical protein